MSKPSAWPIYISMVVVLVLAACSSSQSRKSESKQIPSSTPVPIGPERIVLLDESVSLQDEREPFRTSVVLDFELPSRPRRARLVLRYSGVPGATSEDYLMGRFRHKVDLNKRYLMDLNTFSQGEDQVVEHTKWISVGMLRRQNTLEFLAGDDGNREARPNCDEFELRSVLMEFDW